MMKKSIRKRKLFKGLGFLLKLSVKHNPRYIVLSGFKQLLGITLTIVALVLPRQIINAVFVDSDTQATLTYLLCFLGILLTANLAMNFTTHRIIVEKMVVYRAFQIELARKMTAVPLSLIESASFLDMKAKAEQFIYTGGAGFCVLVDKSFDLIGKAVSLCVIAGIISTLDLLLVIVICVITVVNVIVNYISSRNIIRIDIERSVQERRASYYNVVMQDFKFAKEIRVNDCANYLLSKFNLQLDNLQGFYVRKWKNNVKYGSLTVLISAVQQAVAYGFLIIEAFKHQLVVGDFSMMLSAITNFSTILKDIIGGIADIQQYNDYYESFQSYFSVCEEAAEAHKPESGASKVLKKLDPEKLGDFVIKFENVSFCYPGRTTNALNNLTCEIRRGDFISVIGENGAGKSTFIKLLLKLYTPTSGRITLNGIDIARIEHSSYLKLFASVFQDYMLFSFPLKENITLGAKGSEDEKVYAVLDTVDLTERVKALPNQIDTVIYREFDENGYYPSGGEAQRIAIARALYRDCSILIFDEVTASLDPNIEYRLNERIYALYAQERTIVNISHRLRSTRLSTKIFVLENGALVEQGTHDELMATPSRYKTMFDRQAANYQPTQ